MSKPLTKKQEAFVNAYVGEACGNGTRAAIVAGYSENTAHAIAWENLRKPEIAEEIKKKEQDDPNIATGTERLRALTTIMRDKKNERTGDRLAAVGMLSKLSGDFIERSEVTIQEHTVHFEWVERPEEDESEGEE